MPTSKKISELSALLAAAAATGDYLPIVDISEASAADKNKRITLAELAAYIASTNGGTVHAGKTTAPGVGDDSDDDYAVGDLWIDETGDAAYIVLDVTVGAAIWRRIDTSRTDNVGATTAPVASDDTGDGYSVGSLWVDVTNDIAYICLDATTNAAVWQRLGDTSRTDNLAATTAPVAGDDTADGYSVGSLWVDVTNDVAYICLDASAGAAVWLQVSDADTVTTVHAGKTTAPGTSDDATGGYGVGDLWIDETNDAAYICLDSTTSSAVWQQVGTSFTVHTGQTTAPTAQEDAQSGYAVGDLWIDETNDAAYISVDSTGSGAVWRRIDNTTPLAKLDATAAPVAGDDTADGYGVGSIWCDVTNDIAYICLDASAGAAVWQRIGDTTPLAKLDATAAPTTGDDTADGYSVGSIWCDVTNDQAYICLDASAGAAVWTEITQTGGGGGVTNKFDATADPTVDDDSSEGYSVGSLWVNTTDERAWICTITTEGAASWQRLDNVRGPEVKTSTSTPTTSDDSSSGYAVGDIWVNTSTPSVWIATDVSNGAANWEQVN